VSDDTRSISGGGDGDGDGGDGGDGGDAGAGIIRLPVPEEILMLCLTFVTDDFFEHSILVPPLASQRDDDYNTTTTTTNTSFFVFFSFFDNFRPIIGGMVENFLPHSTFAVSGQPSIPRHLQQLCVLLWPTPAPVGSLRR